MISVLVTGTGALGVGEGIVQCLSDAPTSYRIIAGNMNASAASLFDCDLGVLLPRADSPAYLDAVLRVIEQENIRFLIPGSEPELLVLTQNTDQIQAVGCTLLANPHSVVKMGDDKWETFLFLESNGLPTPLSSLEFDEAAFSKIGWPLVLKPRSGGGGRNVFVVNDMQELRDRLAAIDQTGSPMMIQTFLPDANEEFTASALFDMHGRLIGSFAARRTLFGGATGTVEIQDFPEVRLLAEQVGTAAGARGCINIQCRVTESGASIFEINTRFSGSAPFRALAGFNEPHLLIQSVISGSPVDVPPIRHGSFGVRSFSQSLVDLSRRDALMDFRSP